MFLQQIQTFDLGTASEGEARSIGSILKDMPALAAILATCGRP
ncbi:hypothetical protein [Sphingomonas sp. M1-B02]|nr:hypothetical protein [Sphingomonas sp. S6-11]UZK66007.1 hypothetical protein OKW87_16090 [Sphingomonas sp. S6-11]